MYSYTILGEGQRKWIFLFVGKAIILEYENVDYQSSDDWAVKKMY